MSGSIFFFFVGCTLYTEGVSLISNRNEKANCTAIDLTIYVTKPPQTHRNEIKWKTADVQQHVEKL